MRVSEHANYLLNEYGRLQFDYAAYCKPNGESLRNEARNNLEEYIAELEAYIDELVKAGDGMQRSLNAYLDYTQEIFDYKCYAPEDATSKWQALVKDWKERMTMSELKPCPFCGEMPQVNTWMMHGITESRCFCDNEKCPVYLSKTIAIDDWNIRPIEDALNARIAELEGFIDRLIEVGDWLNAMHEDGVFVDELNAARTSWKLAVSDWQAMPSHVTNPLDSQGIVTRNGGEG